MRKQFSIVRVLLISARAFVLFCIVLFALFFKGLCEDFHLGGYISQNNEHEAVYYRRDCGATTPFVDNIKVDGKIVFRSIVRSNSTTTVKWIDDSEIKIESPKENEVRKLLKSYKKIRINFISY